MFRTAWPSIRPTVASGSPTTSPTQVWSIDIETGEARLEISFRRQGADLGFGLDFHDPSLEFSADGEQLIVGDVNGVLWIFSGVGGGKKPPVAQIEDDFAGEVIPLYREDGLREFVLDGSASTAGEGLELSYQWTLLSGPGGVDIDTPDEAATRVSVEASGIYIFGLTVDDGSGVASIGRTQRPLGVLQFGAEFDEQFDRFDVVSTGGRPGEIAFATQDEGLYYAQDLSELLGGGVYRVDRDGHYSVREKIARSDNVPFVHMVGDDLLGDS